MGIYSNCPELQPCPELCPYRVRGRLPIISAFRVHEFVTIYQFWAHTVREEVAEDLEGVLIATGDFTQKSLLVA